MLSRLDGTALARSRSAAATPNGSDGLEDDIIMIKGFAHVCVSASDLTATERFYCSGLGFAKTFDFIRNGRVIGFYLSASCGCYLEVFQTDGIELTGKPAIRHFCLEVDDVEQIRRRLIENGYEATEKKLGADQSWQTWTTDPSGVKIEFHQYTDRSSQVTHKDCVLDP